MTNKLLLTSIILLLFSACTQIDYKGMYDNQSFDYPIQTQGQNDHNTIQNGQNPMKRPSYYEYRQR